MAWSKQQLGLTEGYVSVVLNTGLFALKIWVGIQSGSVAMVADAWHTLSDTLTSIVVILGFWIAGVKADREHPFGHGRAEVIAAVVIGVLLVVVGVNFLRDSVDQLRFYKAARFSTLAIAVFASSFVLKEALAQFSIWAGRKTGSQSLLADGWHHRSDAVASGLIVVGALVGKHLWWMDGVLGVGVSLLILYAAWDILRSAIDPLMGELLAEREEQQIWHIVKEVAPEADILHHLHLHRYGDHREVSMHLRVPDDFTVRRGHDLASAIEAAVVERLGIELTIHLEPLGAGPGDRPPGL